MVLFDWGFGQGNADAFLSYRTPHLAERDSTSQTCFSWSQWGFCHYLQGKLDQSIVFLMQKNKWVISCTHTWLLLPRSQEVTFFPHSSSQGSTVLASAGTLNSDSVLSHLQALNSHCLQRTFGLQRTLRLLRLKRNWNIWDCHTY